jgi:hypothetical protein
VCEYFASKSLHSIFYVVKGGIHFPRLQYKEKKINTMSKTNMNRARWAAVFAGILLIASAHAYGAITVTSQGPMAQINTGGLPGSYVRDLGTLWNDGDPQSGAIFFCQSATTPYSILRATTTDGGLTWTSGVDTNLNNPSLASADERNPVIRDFDFNGNLTGFFGTRQGTYGGFGPNDVLFRGVSSDNGASWSGEALVSFGTGAFPGHTGLNGFIEVFKTSTGILRGYTAMNNTNDGYPNPSGTHRVESSDGGATWADMGNISLPGPGGTLNVVSANGPVFSFQDVDSGLQKMGWFLFGEGGGNRGVNLLISSDEGLSWTSGGFSFLDATIRSGDANFLSDSAVRLFYYRNTGTVPSDRQLWYEDFTLSGMSGIQPNNLTVPEPGTLTLLALGGLTGLAAVRIRRRT